MARHSRLPRALSVFALLAACREPASQIGSAPPAESELAPVARASLDAGERYPAPALDLPAARLSERVDGAEVRLRRLGCKRLRFWRLGNPPADLEVLTFSDEQGARSLLVDEVGTERSMNTPGDEGWVGRNALYFRNKAVLVRVIADGLESSDTLLAAARRVDKALSAGEVAP